MLLLVWLVSAVGCGGEAPSPQEMPPEAAPLISEMHARYAAGEWDRALALADTVAARHPELPTAPLTRGLILTKLKQYDAAERAYKRALELDPAQRTAWYSLGHNAFLQHRYREALSCYDRERELIEGRSGEPRSERNRRALQTIFAQIGRTYDLMGVPDSARTAYEAALEIDSTYAVAHAWLSDHLENAGRLDEALHHAELALERRPEEVEYAYKVGSLLFQTGRTEDALPILAAVVQAWPGHEGAAYNLGRAFMAAGREEEGRAMLDRVDQIQALQQEALLAQREVETYPNDPKRWTRLAGLMLRSGYLDKAEEAFSAALARDPENLDVHNDLANLALVRGDTALAVRRFETLLQRDSTFADAWLNLGIIHAMQGRNDYARAAWQRVLRHRPADADARAYLERLDADGDANTG